MTALERRWTGAILEGFAGGEEGLVAHPGEVDWVGTFEVMRRSGTKLARYGLRLGVWVFALAPLWALGRLRTMAGLSPAERAELIRRVLAHRLHLVRELALLFKIGAATALLGTPSVRARCSYDAARPADRFLPPMEVSA